MLKRAVFVGSAIAAGLWAVPEVSADAPVTDAIVFYSAGVDSILANPKDANLHAALVMMEKNGLSLPPDVGDDDAAIINFLASVILSELDVRMTVPSVPQGQMPFGISVSSKGNAGASPDVLMDRLHAALKGANARTAPSKTRDGFMTMASQYGPPTLFGIEDGSAVFAINGDVNMESIDWSGCGLPAGVDPLMGGIIDFNAMQPFLGMAAMFQPQAAAMMGNFGIMGPDAAISCGAASRSPTRFMIISASPSVRGQSRRRKPPTTKVFDFLFGTPHPVPRTGRYSTFR